MIRISGASAARVTLGAGCLALGVLLALNALDVTHLSWQTALGTYWPGLFAFWGVLEVAGRLGDLRDLRHLRWWPLLVAALGAVLLAANVGWIRVTGSFVWTLIWAALAVFMGFEILRGHGRMAIGDAYYSHRGKRAFSADDADDHVSLGMTHVGQRDDVWELEDRVYHHGIGEFHLDLSKARLREGETRLRIEGGLGDIQVLVPDSMAVYLDAQVRIGDIQLFGREAGGLDRSLTYRSEGYDATPRRLRIDMALSIGGISVERVL